MCRQQPSAASSFAARNSQKNVVESNLVS